jgi:cytochrome d ubiquinol oxidase subunit II
MANRLWLPVGVLLLVFGFLGYSQTVLFEGLGLIPGTLPTITILSFVAIRVFSGLDKMGWAFAAGGLTIVTGTSVVFEGLFPMVMPSSINPDFSLTIFNAASSDYTLTVMSLVALIFVPIVLAYQGWSYWVFKERVTREAIEKSGH